MPRPVRPSRPSTPAPNSHNTTWDDNNTDEEIPEKFNIDADLEIDLNYLHLECQNHASLFMKYSKEAARSKQIASYAEEKVKTIRSQLVKEANENPDFYLGRGIKATAPNVEAYYRDHDDYIAAKKNWIDKVYYADLISGVVFAMQARKTMIELEVKLHGQEYFSVPEIDDLSEATKKFNEMKEKGLEERIKGRLNQRR